MSRTSSKSAAQRGVDGRDAAAGALQHGADGGEDLAEFVVQFARDVAKGVFLNRNQLLGQLAAAFGERRHLFEHFAVVLHQVQAGGDDQDQHGGQERDTRSVPRARESAALGRRPAARFHCFPPEGARPRWSNLPDGLAATVGFACALPASWPEAASAKIRSSASQNCVTEVAR